MTDINTRIRFTELSPTTNALILGGEQYLLGSAVGFITDNIFHFFAKYLTESHGHETGPEPIERVILNLGQAFLNSLFVYECLLVLYGERPTSRDPVAGVPFLLGLVSHQPFFFENAHELCKLSRQMVDNLMNGVPALLQAPLPPNQEKIML